jgi:hypothetical protein
MNHQDIKRSFEARQKAVHVLHELGDEVRDREMTGEEQETFDRNNTDIDTLTASARYVGDMLELVGQLVMSLSVDQPR